MDAIVGFPPGVRAHESSGALTGHPGEVEQMNKTLQTLSCALLLLIAVPSGATWDLETETPTTANTDPSWAWGANENGRLGDGTTTDRLTPVQVLGAAGEGLLTDVAQLSAGEAHTLALKEDGTVWGWGANWPGALGDGTTTDRLTPVQVVGPDGDGFLTDVAQVSGGVWHSLAVKHDGTVWSWGNNYAGALGDGTTTSRLTPTQVVGPDGTGFLTDIVQVSAGSSYSLALREDGTVHAWGDNWAGQLGDGSTDERHTPVPVVQADGTPLPGIQQVAAQRSHGLATATDGAVWAWGDNGAGQLGDDTTTSRDHAAPVSTGNGNGFTGVERVSAGDSHSLALKSDGTAWAWGSNELGQLGDGTTTDRATPVQVVGLDGSGVLEDLVWATTGYSSNIALTSDGTAWGWGYNGYGNLGDGSTTDRHTPVQPIGITDLSQVTLGWQHTIAIGQGVPPADPEEVSAGPGEEIGEIQIAWEPPIYTGGTLTEYRVHRSQSMDGPFTQVATVEPDSLEHTDTGDLLTTYHYRVSAVNEIGEGEPSGTACSKTYPWVVLEDDDLCWVPSAP